MVIELLLGITVGIQWLDHNIKTAVYFVVFLLDIAHLLDMDISPI